jgi:hypothetical protein
MAPAGTAPAERYELAREIALPPGRELDGRVVCGRNESLEARVGVAGEVAIQTRTSTGDSGVAGLITVGLCVRA